MVVSGGQVVGFAGADQYAALLPLFERVLGAERPQTLLARHNLAHWTEQAGSAGGVK